MPKVQEEARVLRNEPVAEQTYRLRLHAPQAAALARAGQFCMLQVREGWDPLLKRPLSFHRIEREEGDIEVLYRVVGRGTWCLSQSAPGSRLRLIGPLGNGFEPTSEPSARVALVAGGIGIAPLVELLAALDRGRPSSPDRSPFQLFYGARTGAELLPSEYFGDWDIDIHWSTDDGTFGHRGTVVDLLEQQYGKGEPLPSILYACGPLAMQYHVARWALARQVVCRLSLESLMACGIGACLGCALPARHPLNPLADHYVHVCKDGPVFDAESIQWQKIQTHRPAPPIFLCS